MANGNFPFINLACDIHCRARVHASCPAVPHSWPPAPPSQFILALSNAGLLVSSAGSIPDSLNPRPRNLYVLQTGGCSFSFSWLSFLKCNLHFLSTLLEAVQVYAMGLCRLCSFMPNSPYLYLGGQNSLPIFSIFFFLFSDTCI